MADVFYENLSIGTKFGILGVTNYESEEYSRLGYLVSAILGPPSSILKIWPEIRHQGPQKLPYNNFATIPLI